MDKKAIRKKYLVDSKLQLTLAFRMIAYWIGMWVLIFGLPFLAILIYRSLTSDISFVELFNKLIADFWFPMVMSLLALPIVARDCIRFSHRIAGPIYRLNREMKNLAENGEAEEVYPRDGDYCNDLAQQFNSVLKRFDSVKESQR